MKKFILPILLFTFITLNLYSQEPKVRFTANPSKTEIKSGDEFYVLINFDLDKGWHTYDFVDQISPEGIGPSTTEIAVLSKDIAEMNGEVIKPAPLKKMDEGFKFEVDYYEGNFNVLVPIKALKDFTIGKDELMMEVYIQVCDSTRCLPPQPYKVKVGTKIINPQDYDFYANKGKTVISKKEDNSPKTEETEANAEIEATKKKGIWSFLWFAMLAGGAALLTPCVFPMVPITVSFFTKRAEQTKARGLRDSSIYALGIISTFTAIGFALAAILGPTGIRDFAANGWVNIAIAIIFSIFALNLFGAFEIQIPTGIMNKLNAKTQGSGVFSILIMGLVFSLTSFTCTVPFVGSALISASGGEWFYPIIGMLGFSTVFALPFFIFALIPSAMNKLPKAGGWMNNVKVIMGFLEVAAAIKFISNADLVWAWGIMPREFFLSIWIICGIMIVVYLLGAFKMKLDSEISNLSALRVVWAVIFGAITIYLIPGLFGKSLGEIDAFLPPKGYLNADVSSVESTSMFGDSQSGENIVWLNNYDEAVELAKKENKSIFIDFTGWTCTNCRLMESNMFPLPEVQKHLKNMITVKLYTDRRNEPDISNQKMQLDRFGSIDIPLYVILTPDEELIGTKPFTRDVQGYLDFLKKGSKL